MNKAYSYYDTKCIMVCCLRRWYYEEPNTRNTMVCSQLKRYFMEQNKSNTGIKFEEMVL